MREAGSTAEQWTLRLGSAAGVVGAVIAMVANLLHPQTPAGDPEGVARAIVQSDIWVAGHLALVVGLILILGGLAAISHSIQGGVAGALSRLGYAGAIAGITVGLILVTLDGLAAKHLALQWAAAPAGEAAIALRLVQAEEIINFALAALFNILFAGVTFILYGLAVAFSPRYPRWIGLIVVLAGAGSVIVGLNQAYAGESTSATRILTIIFPTIITLWLAGMCAILFRSASSPVEGAPPG